MVAVREVNAADTSRVGPLSGLPFLGIKPVLLKMHFCSEFIRREMLAINLAGQAGDIHEDVVATIEVALLETDSYRQCCKPTGFEIRDLRPTGAAAALFMDN